MCYNLICLYIVEGHTAQRVVFMILFMRQKREDREVKTKLWCGTYSNIRDFSRSRISENIDVRKVSKIIQNLLRLGGLGWTLKILASFAKAIVDELSGCT